jgi:hypothetical protein
LASSADEVAMLSVLSTRAGEIAGMRVAGTNRRLDPNSKE